MKTLAPLSDTTIRNIKIGDSRKRLSDGNGLYLLLFVKGGSHGWRFDYSFEGRRKTLSLGTYPDTSLKLAREKATLARSQVAAGMDPSAKRKAAKEDIQRKREIELAIAAGHPVQGTFEYTAREWFSIRSGDWSESYGQKVLRRLEMDVFPWLGSRPIGSITPPEVLDVLRRIEFRGVIETAHRVKENCGQVFRYAVSIGLINSDPSRDLKDALRKPSERNFAAITKPDKLAELLRAIYGYSGSLVVRTALKLAPMLLLRPGELRFGKWEEFDLDAGIWSIPSMRMKRKKEEKEKGSPHLVYLPTQAVELLRDLQPLTGPTGFVFRGERDYERAMSENTINAALRRMGYNTQEEVTGHGFRATARTLLEEELNIPAQVIEAQLAHTVPDALGTAYNRTSFLAARKQMLQVWADYLDTLRTSKAWSKSTQTAANADSFRLSIA